MMKTKQTLREQLDELAKKIDDLEAIADKASREAYDLRVEQDRIKSKVIKEEGLLAGHWKFRFEHELQWIKLDAIDPEEFLGLHKFLQPAYYDSFHFWGDIILRFGDGAFYLSLARSVVPQFVKDYGIVVDWSELTQHRNSFADDLKAMDELVGDYDEAS